MLVPVLVTALVMLPFLLFVCFPYESLVPKSIQLHELPAEARSKAPVNPNVPFARGRKEEEEQEGNGSGVSLEEVLNPFLDKTGATVGGVIMFAALVTILVLNAADSGTGKAKPVFYVTLPAAFVLFCFDIATDWKDRHKTRQIAREGRKQFESARAERRASQAAGLPPNADAVEMSRLRSNTLQTEHLEEINTHPESIQETPDNNENAVTDSTEPSSRQSTNIPPTAAASEEKIAAAAVRIAAPETVEEGRAITLTSIVAERHQWAQETFPTVMAVLSHLPFALVPFGLCMFVLVEGLTSRGWISVFAYGWDHWVTKTGTVGA
jgi:hypothetical protein